MSKDSKGEITLKKTLELVAPHTAADVALSVDSVACGRIIALFLALTK
jgi:hypothetical protein